MNWDAWGMFTGALEQYNDEDETVVIPHEDKEPDSEPPPMIWPENPPFDVALITVPATPELLNSFTPHKGEFVTFSIIEEHPPPRYITTTEMVESRKTWTEKLDIISIMFDIPFTCCPTCGATVISALGFCLHCGHPNMVKCPNGEKPCLMCRKHPGWVEELKP